MPGDRNINQTGENGNANADRTAEARPSQPAPSQPVAGGRGFAGMDEEKRREASRKGGQNVPDEKRSFSQDPALASEAGRKGGQSSGGNFANDPQRAAQAGRKGGEASALRNSAGRDQARGDKTASASPDTGGSSDEEPSTPTMRDDHTDRQDRAAERGSASRQQ